MGNRYQQNKINIQIMNRRNPFKTGMELAGGSMLASVTLGGDKKLDIEKSQDQTPNSKNNIPNAFSEHRKPGGKLEVSGIGQLKWHI